MKGRLREQGPKPGLVPLFPNNNKVLSPVQIDAEFPEKLQCLFRPKRMKILYGGRGAGRSWGVSRALLLIGTHRPIRVLCCRELQKSISESVHKVLSDQVVALGQGAFYEIQANKIIGKNGTTFSFEGIRNNATAVKSYEGIDYCWVEEGDKVSKASWEILLPTIRKKGSEIIVTFNPSLADDYTYRTFVLDSDLKDMGDGVKESDDTIVVKMTYQDNPWFFHDTSLPSLMEKTKRQDPDAYLNVWLGNPVEHLEGAVYAKQLRKAKTEGRICQVPWEKEVPVQTAWDVGRADATSIWFFQKVAFQNRILAYFEDKLQDDVSYYLKECQRKGFVYEQMWLPHDAKAKRLGTKRSIYEQVKAAYPTDLVPKLSIADGINAARMIFHNCYFDESGCEDGLQTLRNYKYKVIEGQLSNEPLHNWASHGADAFRYLALVIGRGRGQGTATIAGRLAEAAKSTAKAVAGKLSGDGTAGNSWLGH